MFFLVAVFLIPVYSLKIVDTVPFSVKWIGPGIIEAGKGTAYRKIFLYKKNHIYDYKFNALTYEVKFKKDCAFFKIKDAKEWSLWISNDSLTRQLNEQLGQTQIQNTPKLGISVNTPKNKIVKVTQSNQQTGTFSANLRNINFSNLVNQPQTQPALISFRTSSSVSNPGKIVYRGGNIVGDIDNNGQVDKTDYLLLSSYLGTRVCNSTYDINGDGKFDWADIRCMKEVYLPTTGGNTGGGNTGGGNTGGGNTGGGNTGGGNTGGGNTGGGNTGGAIYPDQAPGETQKSISGRQCRIYVPAGYDKTKQYPLIITLHGVTTYPTDVALKYQLHGKDLNTLGIVNAQNDKKDFIIVAPISANPSSGWSYQTSNAADITFVEGLYSQLKKDFNVGWVFLDGHSSGGFMSFYYGIPKSDKYDGFSTTGAFMPQANAFGPPKPVHLAIATQDNVSKAKQTKNLLSSKGFKVTYEEFAGVHANRPLPVLQKKILWMRAIVSSTSGSNSGGGTTGAICTEIYNQNGILVQKCTDTAGALSLKVVKGTEVVNLTYAENKTIVASFTDGTKYDIVVATGGASCTVTEQIAASCTEIYNQNGILVQKCTDTAGALSLKVVKGTEELNLTYAENKTIVASFSDGSKYDIIVATGGVSCTVTEQVSGGNQPETPKDLSRVTFLDGAEVKDYPETSKITKVKITDTSITIEHTMAGKFPVHDGVEGNPWVIANIKGKWYTKSYEWLRPGQTVKALGAKTGGPTVAEQIGPHIKTEPLKSWVPKSGEKVGFFITTLARHGFSKYVPTKDRARSDVHWTTWP